jgi:hypothetical protein
MPLTPHETPESGSPRRDPIHREAPGDPVAQSKLSEPNKKCDDTTSPSIARGVEYLISELSRP